MGNLIAFRVGFKNLCLAKYVEYDDNRMQLYYEKLKNFDYILDVLDNSVKKPYRRTQSFPLIEDLREDHRDIFEEKRHENADKFGLETPVRKPIDLKRFKLGNWLHNRADRHGKFGMEKLEYINKRMGWGGG